MSNDITLKPSFKSNREEFEQYIEDIEVNFKTPKGSFIGTFNTWNIIINLNSNIEVPENIKFNFFIDGIMHKTPTFQLTPTVNDETQEEIVIKGHDKSILFDTPFEWTQTLPCTIGQLAQNICNKVGIPIKDINFINSDFVIYRQIADNKKTNREVIAMISAIAAGNAFINEDDELEIRSFIETSTEIEEYFESEKFIKVGPITGVNLAREPIKQYEEKNDDYLASQNKKIVVKITNNLIVDDNRELALPAIYNKLHGLEFYCKKIETYEAYFIKPFSFINSNNNKVLVDTICLKYPSLLDSYISSNNLDEISSNSKSKSLRQRIINAEAKVDEVEGKIVLLTEEVTDYENKIAQIEQTVDSFTQKVENEIDITREVRGHKEIVLENCIPGQVLELEIDGNNTVFDYLLPSDVLLPDDDLLPYGDSQIEIIRQVKDEEGNISEESEIIDLGITERLRQKEEVKDCYRLKDNKAQVIRRIGVLEDGTTYVLSEEKIEELGELKITLNEGTNKIRIVNYTANLKARYVIKNDFSTTFASYVQVSSLIRQTTQEILMQLSQKVGDEEIIAKLNMAIKDGQSIIELIGDIVKIKSKYFELTEDGQITALKGIIAGLVMSTNNNGDSYLYKNYKIGDKTYQSGLFIPKEATGGEAFIYAGVDITNGGGYLRDANTIIQHNGLMKAKWFSVNGESGYFFVDYDSGKRALDLNKDGIIWKLDNEKNNNWCAFSHDSDGQCVWLYDAPSFQIYNGIHKEMMLNFKKYNPLSTNPEKNGSQAWFFADINVGGSRHDNINNSIYVQGYEVRTSASDIRLKKRIKEPKKRALPILNQISIKEFQWRNPKKHKRKFVDFGYLAQPTQEILKSLVIYNADNDTYQMDLLSLSALHTKAIQEICKENKEMKAKIDKQEKIINFLINKLNCEKELKEYMKGEAI